MAGRSVGKSKYRKVADELRDNILSGRYAPGEPFPSVKMLCTRFGVSHLTAVKVVETLKGMGLVHARNGVGTFVARNAKHIGLIVPTVRQAEIFPPIVREISRLCQGCGIGIDFADISCETSDNGRATVLETARRMAESTPGRHCLLQRPRRRERAEIVAADRQALPRRRARHRRERRRPGDARLADAHDRAPAVRGDCTDRFRDLAVAHGESDRRTPAHHGRHVSRRPRFHAHWIMECLATRIAL